VNRTSGASSEVLRAALLVTGRQPGV